MTEFWKWVSGLGILASAVAEAAADVTVVGVECSATQIAAATPHRRVRYVQGDAHHLEFDDATFDVVYARYVLEHLRGPLAALMEMRRVTRPGGRVACCENDTSLVRLDPPCPTFETVWVHFQDYQRKLGGDSLIGRRLYRLFRDGRFLAHPVCPVNRKCTGTARQYSHRGYATLRGTSKAPVPAS
jgi:ubiquinone/menaquinone biosynthesis C-methylase UbiE